MKRHQSGVALVLVLWAITLLSVVAGNFAYSMRSEAQIARNLLAAAQAKSAADAGVQRAWFELLKPATEPQRWQGNGVTHEGVFNGAQLRITLLDESGKIDLNFATDALLKGLFASVGLTQEASATLLDQVLDWRDPDKLRRPNGAEEDEYRAAGKNYTPSNAPFETVDELQRLLGMNADLYHKLAPALTVHSRMPGVNTAVAPYAALLALPGVGPASAEQYVRQRQNAYLNGQSAPPLAATGAFVTATAGRCFLFEAKPDCPTAQPSLATQSPESTPAPAARLWFWCGRKAPSSQPLRR
jgi:general secretion pathway protein K